MRSLRRPLALALILSLSAPLAAQMRTEFRAVKLTNVDSDVLFDDLRIARAMDYLASIGINVVLPVVWNGHGTDGVYTLYPSAVMEELFGTAMYPLFPQARDPLRRVLIEAHRNGMEVYPWFEMGLSPSYSQNGGYILAAYPEWGLKSAGGNLTVKNGFDWMSGINPQVQYFMLALVTEILDSYDVDGIEFSDRIPAMPVEGGYDEGTASLYSAEHGGAVPPANFRDPAWMRWRADKLNDFLAAARDSIKARGDHLILSSSPSVYPWSYEEYLQDSRTWMEQGTVDNLIPQLYRYSLGDYLFELDRSLSYIDPAQRSIFFAGMLIYLKGENYLISPQVLLASLQANRERGVRGEAFFFYEGLRQGNNLLGDILRATYYAEPALNPHRNGMWRPPALIVNEDDAGAAVFGSWQRSAIDGYRPQVLLAADSAYASIEYSFDIPASAWYDVYAYIVTGPLAAQRAPFTVFSGTDSATVFINQQNYYNRGWQHLSPVYLSTGRRMVVRLDNRDLPPGQLLVADATMLMINRRLSPEVVFTSTHRPATGTPPRHLAVLQSYPNPFNERTTIHYSVPLPGTVTLTLHDVLGRTVAELFHEFRGAGSYRLQFNSRSLASGLYFCRLQAGEVEGILKMMLLR